MVISSGQNEGEIKFTTHRPCKAPCKTNVDMAGALDFDSDQDTHSRLITAQIVPFSSHWNVNEITAN
jgi:hypothetical protein